MNKNEYLIHLYQKLKGLNENDKKDAIDFYTEYFEEAGIENEQKVIIELGMPTNLAAQIKAQYATNEFNKDPMNSKKKIKATWLTIVSICAAPIALPLAIALAAVVFSLVLVVAILYLTVYIIVFTFIISGLILLIGSIVAIFIEPAVILTLFGLSLIMSSLSMLLLIPMVKLTKISTRWLIKFINTKILRRNER